MGLKAQWAIVEPHVALQEGRDKGALKEFGKREDGESSEGKYCVDGLVGCCRVGM